MRARIPRRSSGDVEGARFGVRVASFDEVWLGRGMMARRIGARKVGGWKKGRSVEKWSWKISNCDLCREHGIVWVSHEKIAVFTHHFLPDFWRNHSWIQGV